MSATLGERAMYRIQRVLLLPLGGKLFWYERSAAQRIEPANTMCPVFAFFISPERAACHECGAGSKSVLKRVSGRV